jgi:hypothetical protein
LLAGSNVKVADSQAIVWCNESGSATEDRPCCEGARFCISSNPELQMSGGKRFTQTLTIAYRQQQQSVHSTAGLEVAASVWGLSGTIETIMLEEATRQLRGFLTFAEHYYQNFRKPAMHRIAAAQSASGSGASSSELVPASPQSDPGLPEPLAEPDGDVMLRTQASSCLGAGPASGRASGAAEPSGSLSAAQRPPSRESSGASDQFQDVVEFVGSEVCNCVRRRQCSTSHDCTSIVKSDAGLLTVGSVLAARVS